MNSMKSVLIALAGVALGAVAGTLLAPARGFVTQRRIAKKSGEYAEELEEKFNEMIDQFTQKFRTLKNDLVRKTENGKSEPGDRLVQGESLSGRNKFQ
jgi:gas vesicle protein